MGIYPLKNDPKVPSYFSNALQKNFFQTKIIIKYIHRVIVPEDYGREEDTSNW